MCKLNWSSYRGQAKVGTRIQMYAYETIQIIVPIFLFTGKAIGKC